MKEIEDGSIDVAFDKGTLDAMICGSPWSPPDEVLENSRSTWKRYVELFLHHLVDLYYLKEK
jgi:hypothetical protein